MSDQYDLIISGGGLTGMALAVLLAKLPLKIALIDAAKKKLANNKNYQDTRSIALAPTSKNIFSAINLWSKIEAFSTSINKIHVSDQGHFGFTHIDAKKQNIPALGYVVEFDQLQEILHQELVQQENVDVIVGKVVSLVVAQQQASITIQIGENNKTLAAKLIIAADGAQSTIRTLLNIALKKTDYQQVAIAGNLGLKHDHQSVAYERFTEQGPLALLPLGEKRYAYVWSLSKTNAENIMQLSDEAFLAQLQKQFGYRLGKFIWVGQRQQFPLQLIQIQENIQPHVAFLGNASHTLHPIAGQGFNLCLRDAAVLTQLIADYLAEEKPLIDPKLLQDYANARTQDQKSMINLTHNLVKLFSNSYQPLTLLRNLGLCALDLTPGIKNSFIKKTMGFNGAITPLMVALPIKCRVD